MFSENIFGLDEFREFLHVPEVKLGTFANLNQYAIKPAVEEINGMAYFGVKILSIKEGRHVGAVKLGWWRKGVEGLKEAFSELNRVKVGRKARIGKKDEKIVGVQAELRA